MTVPSLILCPAMSLWHPFCAMPNPLGSHFVTVTHCTLKIWNVPTASKRLTAPVIDDIKLWHPNYNFCLHKWNIPFLPLTVPHFTRICYRRLRDLLGRAYGMPMENSTSTSWLRTHRILTPLHSTDISPKNGPIYASPGGGAANFFQLTAMGEEEPPQKGKKIKVSHLSPWLLCADRA